MLAASMTTAWIVRITPITGPTPRHTTATTIFTDRLDQLDMAAVRDGYDHRGLPASLQPGYTYSTPRLEMH